MSTTQPKEPTDFQKLEEHLIKNGVEDKRKRLQAIYDAWRKKQITFVLVD